MCKDKKLRMYTTSIQVVDIQALDREDAKREFYSLMQRKDIFQTLGHITIRRQ